MKVTYCFPLRFPDHVPGLHALSKNEAMEDLSAIDAAIYRASDEAGRSTRFKRKGVKESGARVVTAAQSAPRTTFSKRFRMHGKFLKEFGQRQQAQVTYEQLRLALNQLRQDTRTCQDKVAALHRDVFVQNIERDRVMKERVPFFFFCSTN